jgi:hypothetical protein
VIRVDSECPDSNSSELLVANGNGVWGSPTLVGLQPSREEVNIRLERGLERLIPIHQVGEYWQRLSAQGVQTGSKNVCDSALIHEDGHLRITNGELAAILDFAILHGISIGKYAFVGLNPFDDINELLG